MKAKVFSGSVEKMQITQSENGQLHYRLPLGDQHIALNGLIGQRLSLSFNGDIHCRHCGVRTPKSYGQGYCYTHFTRLAQNDRCIMSPQLCHFQKATCREPDWGERFCLQSHYVYLANAANLKVGITRSTQLTTRWLDQGAAAALPIARVSQRKIAGELEVLLATQVKDKTNWRALVSGPAPEVDLSLARDQLYQQLAAPIAELQDRYGPTQLEWIFHASPMHFDYPVHQYPEQIQSLNPDKHPEISGILLGIKGQYLLFDVGVLNVRRCTGYWLQLVFEENE